MPLTEVASFKISFLQVLDEHGNLDAELDPALEPAELLRLYRGMSLARALDERMLKLQRQGRIGTFAPCIGHEAVCAAALAMAERDWLVGSYRELGARLLRGEPPINVLRYYAGWEEGSVQPGEARMLPIQVVLGSQLPHAVGLAYAARLRGEAQTAVVTFFGDGASSEGDFYEALNFAGVWQVPVVFFCQNNGWAISVPRSAQTRAETIAQKAIACGVPGIQVDGNDALGVYRATEEALARARAGGGPTLIEAVTYRLMMHTTADDPKKYRSEQEAAEWWQREPLARLRTYLEGRKLWDAARQQQLEAELKEQIAEAVRQLEAETSFAPDAPFDHVLGISSPDLDEQRAELLARIAAEASHGS